MSPFRFGRSNDRAWRGLAIATAGVLLLVGLAGSAAASDPFFTNAPFVPQVMAGNGESAAADLDGDGQLDLVQSDKNSDRIGVRLGLGGGRFGALAIFPAGDYPISLALADVDGDLVPDAVVANFFAAQLSVLHGLGGGLFAAPVAMPTGTRPIRVVVADADGDGRHDLLTSNESAGTLTFYRGIPGGFAPRADLATGASPNGIVVARIDGDLVPDLVVACFSANVLSIHRGLGGGTFAAPTTVVTATAPIALAAADLEGDGDLDLVCANFNACCSQAVSIFRSNGDGTFAPRTQHGVGNFTYDVDVADLDGDGAPEIVMACADRNLLSVLQGADGWSYAGQKDTPAGQSPQSVTVADFDGDGWLDAAVGGDRRFVALMHGLHNGSFGPYTPIANLIAPGLALGDLNGDSKLDLVTGSASRLGNGDGTFGTSAFFTGVQRPQLADLNGDGRLDLAGVAGNALGVLLGNGDGTFAPLTPYGGGTGASGAALGDLNGDEVLDAVVTYFGSITLPGGGIVSMLGNGDGSFGAPATFAGGWIGWHGPALADLDSDGDLDLLALDGPAPISLLLGNGDGSFGAAVAVPAPPADIQFITLAPWDAGATPDLILGLPGQVQIRSGVGDGSFGPPQNFAVPLTVSDLEIADLDGDGYADLAASGSHLVAVLRGLSGGGVAETHVYGSLPAVALAVGDLNGDGRPDLLSAGGNNVNSVHALFNAHPGYPTPVQVALTSAKVSAGRVELVWFAAGSPAFSATVERRSEAGAWQQIGEGSADGTGRLRYEDVTVAAGARYAYRLAWSEGGRIERTAEAWVSVPAAAGFTLRGTLPSPATSRMRVAFSLAEAGAARLELFDTGGRRVAVREVGSFGTGEHTVEMAGPERLAPGVYLLRLSQGSRSEVRRATVLE